jgi:hypothetical protein
VLEFLFQVMAAAVRDLFYLPEPPSRLTFFILE